MKYISHFSSLLILFLPCLVSAQNVGIGIVSPTRARLELNGAVDATTAIFGGESSGISLQRNWPGVGFNNYYNLGNKSIVNGFGAKFYLDPNNGYLFLDMYPYTNANLVSATAYPAFNVSPGGNIGLGGAPPNASLQLPNTLANRKIVLWETANNNYQVFGLGIESGTLRYSVAGTDNVHRFYAGTGPNSSTLLMSIWGNKSVIIADDNGGGRLGINLGSPGYTLSIKQAGGTGIYLQEAASGTNWELRAYYYQPTDARDLFIRHNNNDVGYFRSTGEYVAYSDERLKTNIKSMDPVLEKILKLNPSVYEFKTNNPGHEKSVGFIAQDVKGLFPELVSIVPGKNENGMSDLMGVSYSGFGVIAVKAIQEQQQQLNAMQKEIDLLKAQNKMLMQVVNNKN